MDPCKTCDDHICVWYGEQCEEKKDWGGGVRMQLELDRIYCGDCVEVMQEIPDNFIDLTVTSPPYDNLRTYKGYMFNFEAVAQELYRITKRGGVVVWVVGDATIKGSETGTSFKQALYFKKVGFNLHDTMIYAKPTYVPLTHNRYEQQFEYMFIFSKSKPKVFNPIKIPCVTAGTKRNYGYTCGSTNEQSSIRSGKSRVVSVNKEKIMPNIWFIRQDSNIDKKNRDILKHPAIFPEQLAHDHIVSWSNLGNIVLDPMCGSGTTCKMAKKLGRRFLGIDIAPEYVEIAEQRVEAVKK